ncbi:MAG: MlaD family protein [Pseudomonadota bacterium]
MVTIRTKFSVGLFVVIGFVVVLLAIAWVGMSSYFEEGHLYVAYFNESVQGLDKDSPVKYMGVAIGRVDSIRVAPDDNLIEVTLKIEKGLESEESRKNVVAQLKSVGITGIMFVELERKKEGKPDLSPPIHFPSKYPVIATKPSGIKKLFEGIDDVLSQLKSLDMKGISDRLKSSFDSVSQAISDARIEVISSGIRSSLERAEKIMDPERWDKIMESVERASSTLIPLTNDATKTASHLNRMITRLDRIIADNEKGITEAIYDLRRSMKDANSMLGDGASLIKGADDGLARLQRRLDGALENLEKASENLNRLTDLLADQPAQVFFGKPPEPREVEPDTDEGH